MIPGIIEYVSLRLIRRFIFTDNVLRRCGRYLPYYRININENDPALIVDRYQNAIRQAKLPEKAERTILEVGSGATRSVGREILRRGLCGRHGNIILFEPYVTEINNRPFANNPDPNIETRINRIVCLDNQPNGSVDLILSHSVLEHVSNPEQLVDDLTRVLTPSGTMLHAVDYRDHFFKYPYHFLLFSERIWKRWLNPGNLPRWRIQHHVQCFQRRNLHVEVLEPQSLAKEYQRIIKSIHPDFEAENPDTAISSALLIIRNNHSSFSR